jgi:CBS domain containing-hemolysin-like protein
VHVNEIPLTLLQLAAVPLLVLLNGFFVAAEFALVKIRDTQLETLVAKGHRRAKVARRSVRNLDAALSATQLGITLASLGLGVTKWRKTFRASLRIGATVWPRGLTL